MTTNYHLGLLFCRNERWCGSKVLFFVVQTCTASHESTEWWITRFTRAITSNMGKTVIPPCTTSQPSKLAVLIGFQLILKSTLYIADSCYQTLSPQTPRTLIPLRTCLWSLVTYLHLGTIPTLSLVYQFCYGNNIHHLPIPTARQATSKYGHNLNITLNSVADLVEKMARHVCIELVIQA